MSAMDSFLNRAQEIVFHNSWALSLQLLVTICLLTWTLTQFNQNLRSASSNEGTKAIPRVPYWFPVLGNTLSFLSRQHTWLLDKSKKLQCNIFGLKLYGRDLIVVTSPTLQNQLADPSIPVSTETHDELKSSRFFANRYASSIRIRRQSRPAESNPTSPSDIRKLIHLLEVHSYNFISPSRSWVDQAQWERGANVEVIEDKPTLAVSATSTKLVQEFSAHIILSSLLSTSFIEANSGFVVDFFDFSSSYSMFMTGLPYWIAPGLGPPALARERCLLALDNLVDAISAELEGKSMSGTGAGMLYDLDDVHKSIWEIIKRSETESTTNKRTRKCSCEILEAIWNATITSVSIVLWMIIYLYDKDGENRPVLEQIKTEAQKVVKVVKPKPTGLPFEDPPRLEFVGSKVVSDLENECPMLFGAILEILRLESQPEDYFTVQNNFILTADAAPDPMSYKKPALLSNVVDRFQLIKGDRIYAAYGATYKDSYYWDRPRRFAPNRYGLVGGLTTTQARLPKMSLTRHFGSLVPSMYIIIALMSFYDFEDVKHPQTKIIAGVGWPKSDLRVKISRRKM